MNFASPEGDNRLILGSLLDDLNGEDLVTLFNRVPIFKEMKEDDIQGLAKAVNWCIFVLPERIVSVPKSNYPMFTIASGRADVFKVMGDGVEIKMDELDPGSVSGQQVDIMVILTGLSQIIIIQAAVEIAAWEISSDALYAIFERRPIAMKISPKVF